jgi:hypothetical protein
MPDSSPAFLLSHPELVLPVAPWCSWLENHELGILLLAQPGLADEGVRRSELQEQLGGLGAYLPLGPLYFQRVSRSAEALAGRGQLREVGQGRGRRYQSTSAGLGALILNLQVLRADPTVDGREFELKRALVALWNLVAQKLTDLPPGLGGAGAEMARLLDGLGELKVWGRAVVTEEVVDAAFDILGLIRTQRRELERLEEETRRRQQLVTARCALVEAPAPAARGRRVDLDLEEALASVQVVAAGVAPRLECEAALRRYGAYAEYLDELDRLYGRELKVVDLASMRRALRGGRRR